MDSLKKINRSTYLSLLFFITIITICHGQPSQPASNTSNTGGYGFIEKLPCRLVAINEVKVRDEIQKYLNQRAKLIEIDIVIVGEPKSILTEKLQSVFKPNHWVRSTSRTGRSLLMLEDNYDYMSLSFLSIGVESVKVELRTEPIGCLRNVIKEDVLLSELRNLFLRDFKASPGTAANSSLSPDMHICNIQILDDDGTANFHYVCCHKNPDDVTMCAEMESDSWIELLLTLIVLIKVMVVLYSPSFLPESLYRQKYVAAEYIYHLPPGSSKTIRAVVTQDPEQYGQPEKRVRLYNLKNLEVFKTMVESWQMDKIYEVKMNKVRLSVKARRLLGENKVPVGFITMLYHNLFRCRIRKLSPLEDCCSTSIFGKINIGSTSFTWYKCMRLFARLLLLVVIFIPWFIRLGMYFDYEHDRIQAKYDAAHKAGLHAPFEGSFVLYLTPLHGLFVIIYLVIIIDSVVYGVISKAMKEKFKLVLRQCLRDMRERSRIKVIEWITMLIVQPFRLFGVFGFIVFIPYLVLLLVLAVPFMAFYLLPTLNLSVRLIIHIFIFLCPSRIIASFEQTLEKFSKVKKHMKLEDITSDETFIRRQQFSTRGIILQVVVIIMCLISFWSITLLLMEVISFFVEIFIYTFMGIIVNAGVMLQYVTVCFLLFMYGKNTFNGVHKNYLAYHKVIHQQLLSMKRKEINETAKKEATDQENTVFNVTGNMAADPVDTEPQLKVKDKQLQWTTSGMLMFLDRMDTPSTPEKFFFDTIKLNYHGCPGKLYINYMRAFWEFSKILMFLSFVFIVVMAFGDAYKVSTTNQLLATVMGGFIPFFLRSMFSSRGGISSIDPDSIQFLTEFHKAINEFRQSWGVYDIQPTEYGEWDEDSLTDPPEDEMDANGSHGADTPASPRDRDAPRPMSTITIADDTTDVDIIIDVSTSESKIARLLPGFEKGSQSMLNNSYRGGRSSRSARIYKPPDRDADRYKAPETHSERAIDVV